MMSDFVGSVEFTQMAGSVPLAPVTAAVSAAATASPVGWAAEAERRKGAAATTSARPRAAAPIRRDDAGIVWERVADMVVLLVSAGQAGGRAGSPSDHSPPSSRHLVAPAFTAELQVGSGVSRPLEISNPLPDVHRRCAFQYRSRSSRTWAAGTLRLATEAIGSRCRTLPLTRTKISRSVRVLISKPRTSAQGKRRVRRPPHTTSASAVARTSRRSNAQPARANTPLRRTALFGVLPALVMAATELPAAQANTTHAAPRLNLAAR